MKLNLVRAQAGNRVALRLCFSRVFSLMVLLALLAGCGTGPTASPGPPVDPQEILRQSAQRVLALESVEFTLEHQEGTTELLPGLKLSRVYGVAAIPDQFRFTVEAEVSNTFVEVGVVVIGDQAYMTNFLTGQWQEVSRDVLPLNLSNLGKTLAGIIDSVQGPVMVGSERWRDHDAYRIRGMVKSDDLSTLVPNVGNGFDVDLELWVDRDREMLLQVRMSGQMLDSDVPETVRVLALDGIDVPVVIDAPETNSS